MGRSINTARYTVKASKSIYEVEKAVYTSTGKGIKTGVRNGRRVVKKIRSGSEFIKNNGLRKAWNYGQKSVTTKILRHGGSIVESALKSLLQKISMKMIIPLLLIAAVACGAISAITAPVGAIASLFGQVFSIFSGGSDDKPTDWDVREYLTQSGKLPDWRTDYIKTLSDKCMENLKSNGGKFDYVRLYTNADGDKIIGNDISSITEKFYSLEDLTNIIQPIFNAVVLMDYDLEPTEKQAENAAQNLFQQLFSITSSESTEWCGQSAVDGIGEINTHSCGYVHSLADCPVPGTGIHGVYTCNSCCYYYCPGHIDTEGDGETTSCSGCIQACSGYTKCNGHKVMAMKLNMDGIHNLLNIYFTEPINHLSNLEERSEEENERLQDLKDFHQITLEYISQVNVSYGGGMTTEDLGEIPFLSGDRAGDQAIVDLAMSQVGQAGGQPYWSWYGFSSRVEWCACFVSWCYYKTGHTDVRYASCQWGGRPYFEAAGRWVSGGFTNIAPGDTIFFDWNNDGKAQHTAIVIGQDGKNVYTIEGNSGDACKVKCYPLNSSVILGYGILP